MAIPKSGIGAGHLDENPSALIWGWIDSLVALPLSQCDGRARATLAHSVCQRPHLQPMVIRDEDREVNGGDGRVFAFRLWTPADAAFAPGLRL